MLVIVTGWAEGRNTTLVILLTNRTLCKRWSWIKLTLILESLKRFLRPFGEVSTKIPILPKEHILVNV